MPFIQKTWLYFGIFILIFGIGGFIFIQNRSLLDLLYSPKIIYVKVTGQVVNPGIYEMEEGDILKDLIQQAGGLSKMANPDYNPYAVLQDGDVIRLGDR